MNTFSFEKVIARFLKSATNGRVISVRFRRILTIMVIPIIAWGLYTSFLKVLESIEAYQDANELSEILVIKQKKWEDLNEKFKSMYSENEDIALRAQKQTLVEEKNGKPHQKDFFEMVGAVPIYNPFPDSMSIEERIQYVDLKLRIFTSSKNEISALDQDIYDIQRQRKIANNKKDSFLFLFYFVAILVVVPWMLLRLVYWIVDADKAINDI